MITYSSTRGDPKSYTFSEAILQGIAPDGGLLAPQRIPHVAIDDLQRLAGASYQEVALFLFKRFQTEIEEKILRDIIQKAYGSKFDTPKIAPVVKLHDQQYMLELWHGPTAAFKDMALQIMPLFFLYAAQMHDKNRHYVILVATSGDTGKATLEGYRDREHISVIVLYPDAHVSQLQKLQMVTQEGSNVAVFAVQGDFDDAQSIVKKVFMDRTFNEKLLKEKNIFITSANSINWGRLLPQIVYYFTSYIQLVGSGALSWGGQMDIAIPTGNFGNILAAYYAKKMGLPVRKLICASNANNVLTDFLQTGIYDVSYRKLLQTPSPSMDILVASNIERLLFLITNDTERVASWMKDLATKKRFAVDAKTKQILQVDFFADWVSNEACLENIAHVYQQTGYVIDPHTSVAQLVATRYGEKSVQSLPLLIAATAHWSKFAKDVSRSLLGEDRSKSANEYQLLASVCKFAKNASVPKVIMDLRQKEIRHTGTCAPTKEAVEVIIGNLAEEI